MGNEQGKPISDEEVRQREIQKMDADMSRRMARGVDWNLKVVLRGDRNTGKTALFERLKGSTFVQEYTPTPRISTAHINWSYKTSNDVVKVEIWDVVDVAVKGVKKMTSLKLSDEEAEQSGNASPEFELDATTVDVMRGTHAVVITFDPRKRWTWDYVTREVPKIVSLKVFILVIENFRDAWDDDITTTENKRQVSIFEVKEFVDSQGPFVKLLEASMKNCFGLAGVKTFLNMPFLKMQREVIEAKLRRNSEEQDQNELEFRLISEETTYESYLVRLANRNKAVPTETSLSRAGSTTLSRSQSASTSSTPQTGSLNNSQISTSPSTPEIARTTPNPIAQANQPQQPRSNATPPPPTEPVKQQEEKKGFFSSLFSSKAEEQPKKPGTPKKNPEDAIADLKKLRDDAKLGKPIPVSGSIDDFVPDEDLGDDWLSSPPTRGGAPKSAPKPTSKPQPVDDDDDDDNAANPMVAGSLDEVEVDFDTPTILQKRNTPQRTAIMNSAKEKGAKPPSKSSSRRRANDDSDEEPNPLVTKESDEINFDDDEFMGKMTPPAKPSISLTKPVGRNMPSISLSSSASSIDDSELSRAASSGKTSMPVQVPTSASKLSPAIRKPSSQSSSVGSAPIVPQNTPTSYQPGRLEHRGSDSDDDDDSSANPLVAGDADQDDFDAEVAASLRKHTNLSSSVGSNQPLDSPTRNTPQFDVEEDDAGQARTEDDDGDNFSQASPMHFPAPGSGGDADADALDFAPPAEEDMDSFLDKDDDDLDLTPAAPKSQPTAVPKSPAKSIVTRGDKEDSDDDDDDDERRKALFLAEEEPDLDTMVAEPVNIPVRAPVLSKSPPTSSSLPAHSQQPPKPATPSRTRTQSDAKPPAELKPSSPKPTPIGSVDEGVGVFSFSSSPASTPPRPAAAMSSPKLSPVAAKHDDDFMNDFLSSPSPSSKSSSTKSTPKQTSLVMTDDDPFAEFGSPKSPTSLVAKEESKRRHSHSSDKKHRHSSRSEKDRHSPKDDKKDKERRSSRSSAKPTAPADPNLEAWLADDDDQPSSAPQQKSVSAAPAFQDNDASMASGYDPL